jgi:hypothetical protein
VLKIYRITLRLILFGMLVVSLLSVRPAAACTPTVTPPGFAGFSIADHTNASQIIVEGTIRAVTKYESKPEDGYYILAEDEASVQVYQYLKGSGSAAIKIKGFGQSTACLLQARVGDQGIFYAIKDSKGNLWIRSTAGSNPATVAQIRVAAQQSPFVPIPSIVTIAISFAQSPFVERYGSLILVMALAVIAVIASVAVIKLRHP